MSNSATLAASTAAALAAAAVARRYVDALRPPKLIHANTPALRKLVAALADVLLVGLGGLARAPRRGAGEGPGYSIS